MKSTSKLHFNEHIIILYLVFIAFTLQFSDVESVMHRACIPGVAFPVHVARTLDVLMLLNCTFCQLILVLDYVNKLLETSR